MLSCSSGCNRDRRAEVAQLVEHTTENRSVDSSILSFGTNFLRSNKEAMTLRVVTTLTVVLVSLLGGAEVIAQKTPPQAIRLLRTTAERAEIAKLQHASFAKLDANAFEKIKATLEHFIIRQLRAAPPIDQATLRKQLAKVYGALPSGSDVEFDLAHVPNVIDEHLWDSPATRRLWTVAYLVSSNPRGPGTSEVVADCYLSDGANTRLIGRRDSDLSGYMVHGYAALRPNLNTAAFLVYGRTWTSNSLGSWRAIVYECNANGLKMVWRSPEVMGLEVTAAGAFMTIRYVEPLDVGPVSAVYAWTYEVYELGGAENEPLSVRLVTRVRKPQ
jgi:hypothetical protein